MKRVETDLDGKPFHAWVEKIGETLWIHMNGETYTYEPERRGRRLKTAGKAGNGEILAPMPGKVTKIQVKVGDEVQSGQVLLVLEAMKMEYTLKTQARAGVREVKCAVGDQVALGQSLVKLEVFTDPAEKNG